MAGTDSVSIGMFYQFLNQKNIQSATDMVREMDGLAGCEKEGVVIKAEFQSFMKDNWDTALLGEYDNKQVNVFWNSIDTKKSAKTVGESNMKDLNALNENELDAVDKQLAVYEVLNSFMSSVALPAEAAGFGIDNREFKTSINKSLMETCQAIINANKDKSADEVKQLIQDALPQAYPIAERKTVANLLAQKTITDLSNRPELSNLDNKAFEDLQGIVSAYISQRAASGEVDLAEIVNEIRYIINQYFTNAGVNTGMNVNVQNPSALTQYTQMDGLSDLQQARLSAKMNEALASSTLNTGDLQCPQEYVDYYKKLFIESKLNGGQSFTDLMNATNLASEFENFQVNGATVRKLISLHVNAANMNVDWVFHECLCDRQTGTIDGGQAVPKYGFSTAAADAIFENLPFTDLPKSAHEKIMNGEITTKRQLYDYYVEQIRANIDKYLGGSNSSMSVDDAYDVYKASYDSIRADNNSSENEKMSQLKKAAINFCDTVAKKGEGVLSTIKQVFGTEDYKTVINSATSASEINSYVVNLRNELNKLHFNEDGTIQRDKSGIDNLNLDSCFYSEFKNEEGWEKEKEKAKAKLKETIIKQLYDSAVAAGYPESQALNAAMTLYNYYCAAIDALDGVDWDGTNEITKAGTSFCYVDEATGETVQVNAQSTIRRSGLESNVTNLDQMMNDCLSGTGLYVGCDNNATDGFAFFLDTDRAKELFKGFLHDGYEPDLNKTMEHEDTEEANFWNSTTVGKFYGHTVTGMLLHGLTTGNWEDAWNQSWLGQTCNAVGNWISNAWDTVCSWGW